MGVTIIPRPNFKHLTGDPGGSNLVSYNTKWVNVNKSYDSLQSVHISPFHPKIMYYRRVENKHN